MARAEPALTLARFVGPGSDRARVGAVVGHDVFPLAVDGLAELLHLSARDIRALVTEACAAGPGELASAQRWLPPVEGVMEVWAAGVTYVRSLDARVEESQRGSVYEQVYLSERPELFFKAVPWRVVSDGEPVAVRADSWSSAPEPELAVLTNAAGEVVGYTVCNDVSSRNIESENPLYLPQAKVYAGSCAVGAMITPWWEVPNPYDLQILMTIHRDGVPVFSGSSSTALLRRRIEDLVAWLYAEQDFPDGAVLSTGTALVPDLSLTLSAGDRVEITIPGVGRLDNPVVEGKRAMSWLIPGRHRSPPEGVWPPSRR